MSELEIDKLVIIEDPEEQDGNNLHSHSQFPPPAVDYLWKWQLVLGEPLFLNVYIDEGNEANGSIYHRREVCE
jgi:hypothetical protein